MQAVQEWAGQPGACHGGRAGAAKRGSAIPPHRLLHPPFPGTAVSGRGGEGLGRASNVTTPPFPSITPRPRGKHCAWVVLTQLPSPAPGSAPPTFSGAQRRANGVSACPQGNSIRASRCPRATDDARSSVPLTWVCGSNGVGAQGKGFACLVPGSRPEARLRWWGWQGAARLPGAVLPASCRPAGNCLYLCWCA